MNTLPALLANDLRLQYRYGVHAAYGAVIALYVLLFIAAGPLLPGWAVALLVYSDPSALGFFFLGGLMLLEKGEGVRAALAVAPVTARDYLLAKCATLTALALVAVAGLGLAAPTPPSWPLLLISVALTSICFIGLGAAIALRFRTVNAYLIGSAALLTPVLLPAGLALIDPLPLPMALIPPVAQFRLTLVAFGHAGATPGELALMLAVVLAAAGGALVFAERTLRRELGRK